MRLAILDSGHTFWTKLLFTIIRAVSRFPVPDAVKLNRYHPDFYGMPMGVVTQEAMRGPSAWSVGDRELMGACVSKMNECEVCMKTHAGVAALAYHDEARVSAVLADDHGRFTSPRVFPHTPIRGTATGRFHSLPLFWAGMGIAGISH